MVRSINFSGFAEAVFVPPDEVLLTTGEEPVLRWYGLDGAVRREVRFDLAPDPVTRRDRSEIEAYIDQRIADAPESRDEPGAEAGTKDRWRGRRESLVFPETKAHWAGILVSDTGWAWLIKPRPEKFDYTINEVWAARVISSEGRYIGDTTMPALFAPIAVRRDLLLAMVIDVDTGEHIPTVFRLRPNVAGLVFP